LIDDPMTERVDYCNNGAHDFHLHDTDDASPHEARDHGCRASLAD